MVMNTHEMKVFTLAVQTVLQANADWDTPDYMEGLRGAVTDWLANLPVPLAVGNVPMVVRWAILRKFQADIERAVWTLANLRNYGDYWGFTYQQMFHGVERDGYIHT